MTAYFVTSTGTGIGKTYVTAALIRHFRAAGRHARGLKPIVSGFPGADLAESDPAVLVRAMGQPVDMQTVAAIAPFRFAAPLSPDMAAAREGRSIPYADLLGFCRAEIAEGGDPLFVEGVGGAMVPLDAAHTVRDWIGALGLPVVLVAGGYLGTISHTLTALEALKARRIVVAALVLNAAGPLPVPCEETAEAIARFAPGIAIVGIEEGGAGISSVAALLDRAGDAIASADT